MLKFLPRFGVSRDKKLYNKNILVVEIFLLLIVGLKNTNES